MADDLDNAIGEFGEWVDSKIRARIDEYVEEVRERDAERAHASRGGGRFVATRITSDRVRELWEEAYWYWVKGYVRRYYGDMSGKTHGVVWMKRATYDPTQDADWKTAWDRGEVTVISLGDTGRAASSGRIGAN